LLSGGQIYQERKEQISDKSEILNYRDVSAGLDQESFQVRKNLDCCPFSSPLLSFLMGLPSDVNHAVFEFKVMLRLAKRRLTISERRRRRRKQRWKRAKIETLEDG